MLDQHGVQFLVLDPLTDGELLRLVRSRPGWSVDFDDGKAVVLARPEPTERAAGGTAESASQPRLSGGRSSP
jgi:hypothetical protein